MVIKELPSGTIDLEMTGGMVMVLQFNANCDDALPYCKAMCCKMRMGYNVELDSEECKRFSHVEYEQHGKLIKILPWNKDYECTYLEDNRCSVHERKPRQCLETHCSPRGNPGDETIKNRQDGWLLTPMGAV